MERRKGKNQAPVALLAEGVDRNTVRRSIRGLAEQVALLAEGVDRNASMPSPGLILPVALLAEGVDRNILCHINVSSYARRPPRGGRG